MTGERLHPDPSRSKANASSRLLVNRLLMEDHSSREAEEDRLKGT
jgi:hypothetical protein